MHDSVSFDELYDKAAERFPEMETVVADSAYKTPHIWKGYEELVEDARCTLKYQKLYRQRKETIERVFSDAKEKHAMRYTRYKGLAQTANWVKLKFLYIRKKSSLRLTHS